jgi:hypothetical protein
MLVALCVFFNAAVEAVISLRSVSLAIKPAGSSLAELILKPVDSLVKTSDSPFMLLVRFVAAVIELTFVLMYSPDI